MKEAKVWEEEWDADAGRLDLCRDEKPYGSVAVYPVGLFYHCATELECREIERAKLAGAAPELARLLRRIESLHDSEDAFDVAKAICIEWLPEIRDALKKAGVPTEDEEDAS